MTSGQFTTAHVSDIQIDRESRQRKELTGLEELARSIQTVGLINPIVVERETMLLVAGERRFTAVRDYCQHTHIAVQWVEDLSQEELHLIELEENVKRVNLDWRDQCAAVAQYHELQSAQNPDWTLHKTAEALGISDKEAFSRREVSKALDAGVPLVVEADKYSVARGILERKAQRARESETESLDAMLKGPQVSADSVGRTDVQEAHTTYMEDEELLEKLHSPILHGDFAEFLTTYDGPKFNFLHCDFPYGINAGKHNQGAGDKFGTFEDSEDVYWDLMQDLKNACGSRGCIADSAHMLFWFSMDYYKDTRSWLSMMGWTVNPFPLIWHRNDNSGIMPDPKRGGRRTYETAFHCTRGDRSVVKPVSMLIGSPNVKNIHMSEKPLLVLQHFFRMFVDESTRMLDPTCGSGNAVAQAMLSGAQSAIGIEKDEGFYELAVKNVDKLLNQGEEK